MKNSVLFLTIVFVVFGCSTGKYVSNYKQIKKTIDTLVIISPLVVIDALNYKGEEITDNELEDSVGIILTNKVSDLLQAKYVVKKDMSQRNYTKEEIEEFVSLFIKLKQLKNPISKLKFSNSIYINEGKYYLFVYLNGHYTIGVSPYETLGQGNSINLTPARTANDEVGVLLLNNKKEVLYFNSVFSANDPRLKELVERDLMKVIKSIYYK